MDTSLKLYMDQNWSDVNSMDDSFFDDSSLNNSRIVAAIRAFKAITIPTKDTDPTEDTDDKFLSLTNPNSVSSYGTRESLSYEEILKKYKSYLGEQDERFSELLLECGPGVISKKSLLSYIDLLYKFNIKARPIIGASNEGDIAAVWRKSKDYKLSIQVKSAEEILFFSTFRDEDNIPNEKSGQVSINTISTILEEPEIKSLLQEEKTTAAEAA